MSNLSQSKTSEDKIEEIMARIFARYRFLNDLGISITQTSDVVLQQLINEVQFVIRQNE